MNADSVKAKLKNYARESGRSFQEALVYYGLERTIYRISVSEYVDHFVLKGGIFLYAIFEKNYASYSVIRCYKSVENILKTLIQRTNL